MTIEAKWVGACKPDQKPGDVVMPGGYKMTIKDAAKLKRGWRRSSGGAARRGSR
jgi:hypothetical protein